ncbi:MAG: acetate--CoA ligase family protein [Chloroflexi bacterium]|nr:acetate--CoA ligase family protein [Chloroflexota bacterium]
MRSIFYPSSIVVIGVSEKPDNLARNIVGNLRAFGYAGAIYAVGREPGQVHGVPIVTSLEEVPDHIELAVILTPAHLVPGMMETCARKGTRRVVIESGGFSEFSAAGRQLEQRLVEIAAQYDMRFVGPNCISVVNLESGVCLPFAQLESADLRLGPASVISQSGGVSVTYLTRLSAGGVGVNKGVSIGNKTNLDEDGRRLVELARSSPKPVVVQKANRGQAARAVALSHTAALADDDRVVDAALRQAGILRAESFREAVAIGQALALPPVTGRDLVIISRSGGHAVIAADMAERLGFRLMALPQDFVDAVRAMFRADVIAPTNPLDLGVIFDFNLYADIVARCLEVLAPHAVLLINTYGEAEAESAHRLAGRVKEIMHNTGRPVAFCAYSRADDRERIQNEFGMPVYNDLEEALIGLAASRARQAWLSRHAAQPRAPVPSAPASAVDASRQGLVLPPNALALCQSYGIAPAAFEVTRTPKSAARAAARLGFPVALKAISSELVHKTDRGGVSLNLGSEAEVAAAAKVMGDRLRPKAAQDETLGFMVQHMAAPGIELILGGKQDALFGPVVMLGIGGVYAEIFKDVAFRLAPLTPLEAEDMLEELRGAALLQSVRGGAAADREALLRAILDFSRLVAEHPELSEVEINPLIISPSGAIAVDARAVAVAKEPQAG